MNEYSFKQIAKYFVTKAKEDANGNTLSKSKLHKLMYYAKGFYYVFQNESFFDSTFLVSSNGVKCKELAILFAENNDNLENVFASENDITNVMIIANLDFVYQKIGSLSDDKILEIMQQDELISGKEVNSKIIEENIAKYFRETYLQDEQTNKFGIMRDEIVDMISFMIYKKYDKAFSVLAK